MSGGDKPIESQLVDVDWSRPELQELLAKIEGLRLDSRGVFKPRPVHLRVFWPQVQELGPATLVADDGQGNWVIRTSYPLDIGTSLEIKHLTPANRDEISATTRYLCEVRACRRGVRPEDAGKDVFISTLFCRRGKG